MLLDKEVLIKNNGRIRKHYENLGLDVSKEFIAVPIDLVTKGSHVKVSCSCDICGDTKNMVKDKAEVRVEDCSSDHFT